MLGESFEQIVVPVGIGELTGASDPVDASELSPVRSANRELIDASLRPRETPTRRSTRRRLRFATIVAVSVVVAAGTLVAIIETRPDAPQRITPGVETPGLSTAATSLGARTPATSTPNADSAIELLGPLPIDSAMNRPRHQLAAIGEAVELATKDCMAIAGYTYVPAEASNFDRSFFDDILANRHGLTDPHVAASAGYLNPMNLPHSSPPSNGRPADPTEQAGFDAALSGSIVTPPISIDKSTQRVTAGGCRHTAADQIWGSSDVQVAQFNVIQELSNQATAAVMGSAGYAALNQQWSSCMEGAGYIYADPAAANTDWYSKRTAQADLAVVTSEEQAVALADVACKTSVDYVPTLDSLYAAAEQPIADTHRDDIVNYIDNVDHAATTAAAYIAEH